MNLAFGWLWITLGFASGLLLGLFFHRDDWLGGYASFRRRMLRLGHIAAVALGAINILFALTVERTDLAGWERSVAAWGFLVGGASMPLVCALTAWLKPLRTLFAIPVACLLTAAITVVRGVL